MRISLAISVFLFALSAAETEKTVNAFLGDDVTLPCNCTGRNTTQELKWQRTKLRRVIVYDSNFIPDHRGRAWVFLNDNSSDCSLHLANVTANDSAKYTCWFYKQNCYKWHDVTLNVVANFSFCQHSVSPDGSVECEAEGPHQGAHIRWYLDKELLTNSSTTNITQGRRTTPPNTHHIRSKLITRSNRTAEMKCVVEAPGISINLFDNCTPGDTEPRTQIRTEYWAAPLAVLVLGLVLVAGIACAWKKCKENTVL